MFIITSYKLLDDIEYYHASDTRGGATVLKVGIQFRSPAREKFFLTPPFA